MSIDTADREVLARCIEWLDAGYRVELITVVRTWGSAPRPVGSLAAVRDDGTLAGSVSGGCVEKQLVESFRGQAHTRTHTHRIDDAAARQFGLSCGGSLELAFETLEDSAPLQSLLVALEKRQRIKRVLVVGDAHAHLAPAEPGDSFQYDGMQLQQVFGPDWRVLLIGAGQLSRYVAEFAQAVDFEMRVCEPRAHFRNAWAVNDAVLVDQLPDEAVQAHAADAHSAVLALTHDPSLDDLALQEALAQPVFYVGALGSRRSHVKRCKRLVFMGVEPALLERIHAPIGLDIGSRTSAEIALSIVAQLVQVRAGVSV